MSDDLNDLRRRLDSVDGKLPGEEKTASAAVASTPPVPEPHFPKPVLTEEDMTTLFLGLSSLQKKVAACMLMVAKNNGSYITFDFGNSIGNIEEIDISIESSDDDGTPYFWSGEEVEQEELFEMVEAILVHHSIHRTYDVYEGSITIRTDGNHTYDLSIYQPVEQERRKRIAI